MTVSDPLLGVAFVLAAAVSLAASWLLVTSLERVGARLGLTEALLGLLAALAADAPEITAAVTALVRHDQNIGAGVVIGSNVFNLAALLGLSAVVAGQITLHPRVIELSGAVALWIAAVTLALVTGVCSPVAGLLLVLAVLAPYVAVLAMRHERLARLRLPRRWHRLAPGRPSARRSSSSSRPSIPAAEERATACCRRRRGGGRGREHRHGARSRRARLPSRVPGSSSAGSCWPASRACRTPSRPYTWR